MSEDDLLDDDLKAAFRSVRDAYDGTNPEANSTLHRALFRTRTRERRHRFTRWVVVPIAAVLAASTAWAGVTGKLTPAVQSVLESFHAERTPPAQAPAHAVATSAASMASAMPVLDETPPATAASPSELPPENAAPLPPESTPTPASARPVASSPAVATARPAATVDAPLVAAAPSLDDEPAAAPTPSASAPDPHAALFAEAHRLHFIERDPARALAAWDRYLATAPNGRFAPEARYNRALSLVRLGRVSEAKTDLEAFASGTYGSYRRDEAKALLDALSRDASRP